MSTSDVAAEPEVRLRRPAPSGWPSLRWVLAVTAIAYALPSVLVTWRAWTEGASNHALCDCGDPALFLWFMGWPAHAIANLINPFYSHAVMVPKGINLLNATSVEAFSIPLAPVTWIWGPAATYNVAITLMPWLSAITCAALLCRYLRNRLLAVLGAGLFAFSPYVIDSLRLGHLMTAGVFLLPLMAIGVDELARVRRHRPVRVGIALGVVLSVQLFISTEMFFLYTIGLTLLGLALLAGTRGEGRGHLFRGLAAAGLTTGVLCAWPLAFALLGPEHLTGPVWGVTEGYGYLWSMVTAAPRTTTGGPPGAEWTGAFSPAVANLAFLGWTGLALATAALAVRRRLWQLTYALVGLLGLLLGLAGTEPLGLWHYLHTLPMFNSVIQERLAVLPLLAIVVLVASLADWMVELARGRKLWMRTFSAIAGAGVLVASSGPVWAAAGDIPLTMTQVREPAWFAANGAEAQGRVILPHPNVYSPTQDALAWQALDGYAWSQPGVSGPQTLPWRAGEHRAAVHTLQRLGFHFAGRSPLPTQANVKAIREAIAYWGVTDVVVPWKIPSRVGYMRTSVNYVVGFYTVLFGRRPVVEDGAFVWHLDGPRGMGKPLVDATAAFERCWMAPKTFAAAYEVTRCVIDWTPRSRGGTAPG